MVYFGNKNSNGYKFKTYSFNSGRIHFGVNRNTMNIGGASGVATPPPAASASVNVLQCATLFFCNNKAA